MANYPSSTATFREKSNLPGMTYDSTKKTTLYVEDLSAIENEVIAIENELGIGAKGTKESVRARLDDIDARNTQYSTSEVDTGKRWLNGEIIYRKVVNTTFNAVYGYIAIPHGIIGLTATRKLITTGGGLVIGGTQAAIYHTLNYADPNGNFIQMIDMTLTNLTFACSYSYGTTRATVVLEYTKS